MAKAAGHRKNRPTFFSLLLTLVFVAAGVFGIYKIYPYISARGGSFASSFLQEKETSTKPSGKSETTAAPTETTEVVDENAAAVARAIGEADSSFSPALLTYCAENMSAKSLQGVLDSIKNKTYKPEVWFTSTGKSLHALNALADGDVEKGIVLDRTAEEKSAVDIAFAGKVNPALAETTEGNLSADLLKAMQGADIQVACNECVFSEDGAAAFRADAKRAKLYEEMGVDVVTLASIHASDYGSAGLASTVAALDEAKIAHIGAGKDESAASTPAYFLAGGRKIALIGTAQTLYWKKTQSASASAAGVFSLTDSVAKAVETAKKTSDYVFVYMNAGIDENASWFDGDQSSWARKLIDAGADGVIGAHSNKVQGMEFYKDKLIVYGLGDLWYDSTSRESGIYQISIAADGTISHSLLACAQRGSKASLCTDADKAAVFGRVAKYCGNVVKVQQDGTIVNNRRG